MLKRCNYCMIPIIFIVNTSEFAYFFFKSGDSHEGRQRLLVLLSPGGIRIEQFVTNCGGARLPYNYLYVSSVIFMSITFVEFALQPQHETFCGSNRQYSVV